LLKISDKAVLGEQRNHLCYPGHPINQRSTWGRPLLYRRFHRSGWGVALGAWRERLIHELPRNSRFAL